MHGQFHVQGFSIFPHGRNEEKEQNDEKGVSVKNWPLGGKVEMILCHLERFPPRTSLPLQATSSSPPVNTSFSMNQTLFYERLSKREDKKDGGLTNSKPGK